WAPAFAGVTCDGWGGSGARGRAFGVPLPRCGEGTGVGARSGHHDVAARRAPWPPATAFAHPTRRAARATLPIKGGRGGTRLVRRLGRAPWVPALSSLAT